MKVSFLFGFCSLCFFLLIGHEVRAYQYAVLPRFWIQSYQDAASEHKSDWVKAMVEERKSIAAVCVASPSPFSFSFCFLLSFTDDELFSTLFGARVGLLSGEEKGKNVGKPSRSLRSFSSSAPIAIPYN